MESKKVEFSLGDGELTNALGALGGFLRSATEKERKESDLTPQKIGEVLKEQINQLMEPIDYGEEEKELNKELRIWSIKAKISEYKREVAENERRTRQCEREIYPQQARQQNRNWVSVKPFIRKKNEQRIAQTFLSNPTS